MNTLSFESFFNLSDFEHKDLFSKERSVWEALDLMKSYFEGLVLGTIEGKVHEGAFIKDKSNVVIGEGSSIDPTAYIEGPCLIGRKCEIRHGAYIRPYTIIGDKCVVGHASEIKGSIVLNGAHVPHFNYVGDSILGNKVNLGAGVICANFRLDGKEIEIKYGSERYATKRKKLGAIIGDGVTIGCNCVLNPGTLIAPGFTSRACKSIMGAQLPRSHFFESTSFAPEKEREL